MWNYITEHAQRGIDERERKWLIYRQTERMGMLEKKYSLLQKKKYNNYCKIGLVN